MKKLITPLLVVLAVITSHSAKAQPYLGVQLMFGTEAYTHYRTPYLDFTGKRVVAGTPVINPTVGISGIWAFTDDEDVMPYLKLNSCVTYSPFTISYGQERSQGAANFSFNIGPGIYFGSGLFHVQLLYGYQFNKIDLYGINPTLTSGDRWFGTHTIEFSGGIGIADWISVSPYVKIGFNGGDAFTAHAGIRVGIGFWNDDAAF